MPSTWLPQHLIRIMGHENHWLQVRQALQLGDAAGSARTHRRHHHRRARARGERRGLRAGASDFPERLSGDRTAGARARARLRGRQLLFRGHAGTAAARCGAKSSNFDDWLIGAAARRPEAPPRLKSCGGASSARCAATAACSAIEISAVPPKTRLMPTRRPMAHAAVPGRPRKMSAAENEIDHTAHQSIAQRAEKPCRCCSAIMIEAMPSRTGIPSRST